MTYNLKVEHNQITDELYIVFPQEFLNRVGWVEGDNINWEAQKDGTFLLAKEK
jgi:bifunctional DNA-binding transcriptional regulator/antitoxin component of YhaV-PrlF toxin-antitoxin module